MESIMNDTQSFKVEQATPSQSTTQSVENSSQVDTLFRRNEALFRAGFYLVPFAALFYYMFILHGSHESLSLGAVIIPLIFLLPTLVVPICYLILDSLFFLKIPVQVLSKKSLISHYFISMLRVLVLPFFLFSMTLFDRDFILNIIMLAPYWLGLLILDRAIVYETNKESKRNYFILAFIIIIATYCFEHFF
jgi:hypothetical protein